MGTNKFIYKIALPIINKNLSVSRELRIKKIYININIKNYYLLVIIRKMK
jgi:hypothetical protein